MGVLTGFRPAGRTPEDFNQRLGAYPRYPRCNGGGKVIEMMEYAFLAAYLAGMPFFWRYFVSMKARNYSSLGWEMSDNFICLTFGLVWPLSLLIFLISDAKFWNAKSTGLLARWHQKDLSK